MQSYLKWSLFGKQKIQKCRTQKLLCWKLLYKIIHLSSHLFLAQKPESFFLALGWGFSAEPSQLTTSKRRRSCSASSFPTCPALLLSSHTFLLATGSQTHDLPFAPVPRFFWSPKIASSARKGLFCQVSFLVKCISLSQDHMPRAGSRWAVTACS